MDGLNCKNMRTKKKKRKGEELVVRYYRRRVGNELQTSLNEPTQ